MTRLGSDARTIAIAVVAAALTAAAPATAGVW